MEALVGIDIGTTNIKVIAFSMEGKPLVVLTKKNLIFEENGYLDFDGDLIFKNVITMIKELVTRNIKILSIGISSLAETVFPTFNPAINFARTMVWYDRRTNRIKDRFFQAMKESNFFDITGIKPQSLYSVFKIAWYYQHESKLFKQAVKWLPANSYLGYRLTGAQYIDYTMLSRTGAFDIRRKQWSAEIFALLPFAEDVFPDFINSGASIGLLKKEYQDFLGIDYEIAVSLGGHDHICGNYAAACLSKNVILDSMGTAENIQLVVDMKDIELGELAEKGLFIGLYVIPDQVYVYRAFHYSGALIDNLISLFSNKAIKELTSRDYQQFINEASDYVNRETAIRFFIEDNKDNPVGCDQPMHGVNILNLPFNTKRGEVFMAGIRYLGEKSRKIIYDLEGLTGIEAEVIAIGGSTRNRLLMEEKARILKRDLYINRVEEAVTLGAALLGGMGAGLFKDYQDALSNIKRERIKVQETS